MKVTTNQFVEALLESIQKHNEMTVDRKAPVYTKQELFCNGVLEDYDRVQDKENITRKSVARIIHQTLLLIRQESDEQDWSAALILRDLYDCHTCVRHIAQVYAKGIMGKDARDCFANEEHLSMEEVEDTLDKVWNPQKREVPQITPQKLTYVSYEKLQEMRLADKRIKCIDVRSREMFLADKQMQAVRFENLPLHDIEQNPYIVSDDLLDTVVLKCQRGYLSTLAAKLLLQYGYKNIFVLEQRGEVKE